MNDYVIDLGSEYTRIVKVGHGIVLEEATLASLGGEARRTLIEKGNAARALFIDRNEYTVAPVRGGAVRDEEIAALLYSAFMRDIVHDNTLRNARVIVLVNCGLSEPERAVIHHVFFSIGFRQVIITDNALALYAYLSRDTAFTVNIGADIIDIAATDKGGIIKGCSADLAGRNINKAIADYIEYRHGVRINNRTADKIKLSIGGLTDRPDDNITVNTPEKNIIVRANEISGAIASEADKMTQLIESMLSSLPPKTLNSVCLNGIFMTGGTSQLPGLPQFISEKLKLRIYLLKDRMRAAVYGGERFFVVDNLLASLTMTRINLR
jgi:rod shape-determining protein MreB